VSDAASLAPSARRVQAALDALGLADCRVRELGVPARTAQEAADALGVPVGAIAKSLVFRAASGAAVMVVAAGDRRVDEAKVGAALGEPIGRADAAFVRETTGYAIGGIPPLGHSTPLVLFVDASLARFPAVWAAGGTPHAVFPIAPAALSALPGARTVDVA
jgi:prolyl-tRNA editing enzyme YbaK/EbsC (Cys-tRNA(Pro) deacylase)